MMIVKTTIGEHEFETVEQTLKFLELAIISNLSIISIRNKGGDGNVKVTDIG